MAESNPFFDDENTERLTIEEHAETHMWLWMWFGNEYDRIAWKSLSGCIENAEAHRMAATESSRRRRGPLSPRWGKTMSPELKEKLRKATIETNKKRLGPLHPNWGKPTSENARKSSERVFIVTDPLGKETEVSGLKAFCEEHGLTRQGLYDVVRGRSTNHKNWKCRRA